MAHIRKSLIQCFFHIFKVQKIIIKNVQSFFTSIIGNFGLIFYNIIVTFMGQHFQKFCTNFLSPGKITKYHQDQSMGDICNCMYTIFFFTIHSFTKFTFVITLYAWLSWQNSKLAIRKQIAAQKCFFCILMKSSSVFGVSEFDTFLPFLLRSLAMFTD